MTHIFEQVLRVVSDEIDGDDSGHHWQIHHVLYETKDDNEVTCFDLYTDDGEGNGRMICRGYSQSAMRSMTLRLGTFAQWRASDQIRTFA